MTLIECIEHTPADDMAACLSLRPDTLIFIGPAETMVDPIARYRAFLKERLPHTTVLLKETPPGDLPEAMKLLRGIILRGDECIIDLTGGDEVTLAAVGAIHELYKDQYPVHLAQIEPETGNALDCETDAILCRGQRPQMSFADLATLYGGSVRAASFTAQGYTAADLEPLWAASLAEARWNRLIGYLNEFESRSGSAAGRSYCLEWSALNTLQRFEEKKAALLPLLRKLARKGILQLQEDLPQRMRYTYANELFFACLRKAGNLLEYKVLLEARAARCGGAPLFNDALLSGLLDWDGQPPRGSGGDTKNEIDVIAMRGLTPFFLSCKNGQIEEEELYKLHTVAERFGGAAAKKALIATHYSPESDAARRAMEQRAEDMGIFFLPDAAALQPKDWSAIFEKIKDF